MSHAVRQSVMAHHGISRSVGRVLTPARRSVHQAISHVSRHQAVRHGPSPHQSVNQSRHQCGHMHGICTGSHSTGRSISRAIKLSERSVMASVSRLVGLSHRPVGQSAKPSAIRSLQARPTTCQLGATAVSYTHLRAHETDSYLVCRLLLEKKKNKIR